MIRSSFSERRRAGRRVRIGLWILSLGAAFPGVWALFAPRGFFRDFPGIGAGWVQQLPPFNEHLVRDVGSFYLGFAVLLGVAAVVMDRRLTRVALIAWLVASIPHLIFHATHTDGMETTDAIAQVGLLALAVLIPLALLFNLRRADRS